MQIKSEMEMELQQQCNTLRMECRAEFSESSSSMRQELADRAAAV